MDLRSDGRNPYQEGDENKVFEHAVKIINAVTPVIHSLQKDAGLTDRGMFVAEGAALQIMLFPFLEQMTLEGQVDFQKACLALYRSGNFVPYEAAADAPLRQRNERSTVLDTEPPANIRRLPRRRP